jgi:hypothetical protein
MRGLALLLLWLTAAVVFPACGQAEKNAQNGAAEGTVPETAFRDGEVPLKHDYSFTAGVRMKLPRGFPGDVALYPGAEMRMSQKKSLEEYVLVLVTSDVPARVESWYRDRMRKNGWKPTRVADLDDRRYLRFEKEGRLAAVALDPEDGETILSLICTAESGDL